MRRQLETFFSERDTRSTRLTNDVFAILTIVSIVSLVLETVSSLGKYQPIFLFVEWFAVGCFTIEYLARTYLSKPSLRYTTSFFGIVDLVAILPTYLGLGNFTFLKSARALRIIRMLRMLRLAKVSRSGAGKVSGLSMMWLNVAIYFTTLLFALLLSGTAMYFVEQDATAFASIPAGMWWSLKVFMAGIPVVEPVTALGEIFFVLTRFVGLLMLGLLIGVVGNVFRALLTGGKPE